MEGSEPATRPPSPLALHGVASSGSTVREVIEAQRLRAEIRAGRFAGPTAGLAPGVAQANLVVLPAEEAVDFHKFCLSNPKPCPLLEVTAPGDPVPRML